MANYRPRRTRFRKAFKGTFKTRCGGSLRGTTVFKGQYGLQALEGLRLKDKQLDTARSMMRRVLKPEKAARVLMRVFPHRPVTAKGAETRMGKGKGMVDYYATWVSEGFVLVEVDGARKELAMKALQVAAAALPIRTRIIEHNPEMPVAPRLLPHFALKRLRDHEFANFDEIKAAKASAKTADASAAASKMPAPKTAAEPAKTQAVDASTSASV